MAVQDNSGSCAGMAFHPGQQERSACKLQGKPSTQNNQDTPKQNTADTLFAAGKSGGTATGMMMWSVAPSPQSHKQNKAPSQPKEPLHMCWCEHHCRYCHVPPLHTTLTSMRETCRNLYLNTLVQHPQHVLSPCVSGSVLTATDIWRKQSSAKQASSSSRQRTAAEACFHRPSHNGMGICSITQSDLKQ